MELSKWEKRRLQWQMERTALKRSLEEKIKANNPLTEEVILDMVTSTANMAGIVLPPLPRSP